MEGLPKVIRSTFSTKEAAEYLGVSVDTVRRWVHHEGLPCLRVSGGRKWLFKKEYIDRWLEKRMDVDRQFEEKYEKEYGKLRVLTP